MKLKVVREFIDRHTNKLHKVDEIFEADENRFNEIQRVGNLVEKIEELPEGETTEEVAEKPAKTTKKK